MKVFNSNEEIVELINNNKMALIYFTGFDCGACEAIKHKVEDILKNYNKIECAEISGEKHSDIAAKYDAFSLPLFILYVDGKESIRLGRNVNLLQLEKDIERYYKMIF